MLSDAPTRKTAIDDINEVVGGNQTVPTIKNPKDEFVDWERFLNAADGPLKVIIHRWTRRDDGQREETPVGVIHGIPPGRIVFEGDLVEVIREQQGAGQYRVEIHSENHSYCEVSVVISDGLERARRQFQRKNNRLERLETFVEVLKDMTRNNKIDGKYVVGLLKLL